MTKSSGIGHNLYVAQYDLSGDVGAVNQLAGPRGTVEVTGLTSRAVERRLTMRDGMISFNAFWNTATDQVQDALEGLVRTDRLVTYAALTGSGAVGDVAASLSAKQIDYDPTRGQDGSLVTTTSFQANATGLEWGLALTTGKQSFATGTVSGTSIDFGATDSDFGASAYLHVFSVASGTATFTVQDSDDDSSFAAITGLAFTGATGATSQRLSTALDATIRQYVRVQGTGTHGATVIFVNFVRHLTDQTL